MEQWQWTMASAGTGRSYERVPKEVARGSLRFGRTRTTVTATQPAGDLWQPGAMDDEITLTREELYERVWSTPVSKLAAEFGMSDVGLAKWCKKLDIPRPGLGYWARLAAGQKPKRPKLPPPPKHLRARELTVTFWRRPPVPPDHVQRPRPVPPDVPIPESLHGAHPVVRQLREELAKATPDHNGLLRVSQTRVTDAAIRIGPDSVNRMLRLLAGIFRVLEQRGHRVELGTGGWEKHLEILCCVGHEKVRLTVEEKVAKKPHTATEQEKRDHGLWGSQIPKYDGYPSGALTILVNGGRWSDWRHGTLDDMLGHVVLGVEEAAERSQQARLQWERQEEARREQARQDAIAKMRAEHEKTLAKDFEEMVSAWVQTDQLREFLRALRNATPQASRNEHFEAWCSWAEQYAIRVDPLSKPERVPKLLEPDISKVPEDRYHQAQEWHG
jgi:hypothetical protein